MSLLRTIFKILFRAFVLWIFVSAFVFQTFRIPSSSMYGSLFEGDFVVINKLAYGPRLPITPLALKINGSKKYVDWIQLPAMRMYGYSSIQRNDVIAFNYDLLQDKPADMQEEFIKRVIALPGDTLEIHAGRVYVNAALVENKNVYNTYNVVSETTLDTMQLKKCGIICNKASGINKQYALLMSASMADSVSKLRHITSVTMNLFSADDYKPTVYPNMADFKWNYDYFGPLWIPGKGDSVLLNRSTIILYQRCIETYEKEKISYKNDVIYVSGKPLKYYCFKQDYYFVLGDNRHNSIDSRVIGFIPEDHIIGKAEFILYSTVTASRKFTGIK